MWAVMGLAGAVGALFAGKVLHAGVERRYMVGATLVCAAAIFSVSAFGALPALRRRSGGGASGGGNGERGLAAATAAADRTRLAWTHHDRSVSVNLIGFPAGTALGGALTTRSVTMALAAAGLAALSAVAGWPLIPCEA